MSEAMRACRLSLRLCRGGWMRPPRSLALVLGSVIGMVMFDGSCLGMGGRDWHPCVISKSEYLLDSDSPRMRFRSPLFTISLKSGLSGLLGAGV